MSAPDLSSWDVNEQDFPMQGSFAEQMRFALRYAILAPSSHNSQPWRFRIDDDSVLLIADRTRALSVVDPFDRELTISCGAALFNLRVALAYFGRHMEIHTQPFQADLDVLAQLRINVDAKPSTDLAQLLPEISRRATNRGVFAAEPLPLALRAKLVAAAQAEGVGLSFAEVAPHRQQVAQMIEQGDKVQFDDKRFRRELAEWIHGGRSKDGMPAYALWGQTLLDFAAPIERMVVRTFDVGEGMAAVHEELVEGSPMLACFATPTDDAQAWLATGQALQRVLLVCTKEGLDASFLNQPIEVEGLRARLRSAMSCEAYPQILLRLGKGKRQAHSPRRPLDEVVS